MVRYEFDDDEWSDISEEAKDFIRKLFVVKTDERLTAEQVFCVFSFQCWFRRCGLPH